MNNLYPNNLAGLLMALSNTIDPSLMTKPGIAASLVWMDEEAAVHVQAVHQSGLDDEPHLLNLVGKGLLNAFTQAFNDARLPEPKPTISPALFLELLIAASGEGANNPSGECRCDSCAAGLGLCDPEVN